jgi:hypothetical protein
MKASPCLLVTVILAITALQPLFAQEKIPAAIDSSITKAGIDTVKVSVANDSLEFTRPWYEYQTMGKRDPFESLVPKKIEDQNKIKQLFPYESSTVMGVILSEDDTYALVLDSAKKSYVLRIGDEVIGGQVTDITENAVFLHIVKYGRPMSIVLRMISSRYTMIEERDGTASIRKPGINIEYEQGPLSTKGVIIEEVTVPLGAVRTVEEEWFGTHDPIYDQLSTRTTEGQHDVVGAIMLMEPQREMWIRLPYIMNWAAPGDVVSFILTIDDTPDFLSPLLVKEEITSSSFLLNSSFGLPKNQDLFWKIDALDKTGGRYACKPDSMSFKIIGQ